jgi:hypothetical protein
LWANLYLLPTALSPPTPTPQVISFKHDRPGEPAVPVASLSHQGKVTGLEAFTLDYAVQWPLSLARTPLRRCRGAWGVGA